MDALDDALTVFAATAPSYGPLGLANHGPDGRRGARPAGAGRCHRGLGGPVPGPSRRRPAAGRALWPTTPGAVPWGRRRAIPSGSPSSSASWPIARPRPWSANGCPGSCRGLWARPPTGSSAPAHALRGLGAADTPPRRLELAAALAFWGSTYQELPGPPVLIGHQPVSEALAALPYLPEDAPRQLLISDMVAQVTGIADEFEQGVSSLAGGADAVELLDQLAAGGALAYLRNADGGGAIGLLHSVTSPLACELVLPWLEEEDRDAALGYAWQAAAALHVAYALDRHGPAPARGASSTRGAGGHGNRFGRRARHQADRGGPARLQTRAGIPPCCGRRRTPAPASEPAAARRGGPPGLWVRSTRRIVWRETAMEYRVLGRTGVKVSPLCLGAMMFGSFGNPDHDDSIRIIHRAVDAGINFIDTADMYSFGESEEIVGKALAQIKRHQIVLATKVHGPMGRDPNAQGNSRRWIMAECERSLRRLGTDYIDLYQIHRPSPDTDIDETLGALTDLVRAGKIRYFGSSTFPAHEIVEAQWVSERRSRERFVTEQPPYSILVALHREGRVADVPEVRDRRVVVEPAGRRLALGCLRSGQGEHEPPGCRHARPLRHGPSRATGPRWRRSGS